MTAGLTKPKTKTQEEIFMSEQVVGSGNGNPQTKCGKLCSLVEIPHALAEIEMPNEEKRSSNEFWPFWTEEYPMAVFLIDQKLLPLRTRKDGKTSQKRLSPSHVAQQLIPGVDWGDIHQNPDGSLGQKCPTFVSHQFNNGQRVTSFVKKEGSNTFIVVIPD